MFRYTGNVDGLGTLRLLDAIRANGLTETCKFYQAATLCFISSLESSVVKVLFPRAGFDK